MQIMWQNAAWVCKKLSRVLLLYSACNEAVINNMLVRKECGLAGNYLLRYITSLTSLTVLGTSGNAAATRFGA
jgi:hypothetical protein